MRAKVQHKSKVRGGAVGALGAALGPSRSSLHLALWDVCLVRVLCGCHSDPLPLSLLLSGFSGSLSARLPNL